MPTLTRLLSALLLLAVPFFASAAPERWTKDIDAFTQADATKPPPQNGIVFVGASSIRRWNTLGQDFPGLPVINRGFGGSELADAVFFADRIVIPYKPKAVVLYAGENDLWADKSPETVFADYKAFCAKVHAALPQAKIVFIAIKPSPSRIRIRENVIRTNAMIAAETARDKRLAYVDIFKPMLDASGKDRPELFVEDMLHMNPAGYAVWTPLVAKALK
jgi:lysophospholipase L1-like esterase